MNIDPKAAAFIQRAETLYREKWQGHLEAEHFGELIAVDPESGDYVLGKSFQEIDQAARHRFGAKPTHIFRVGGGGAVRVGAGRHARIS